MKADTTDVSHLLHGPDQYIVPQFQRSYAWQRKHWSELLDDILELLEENARPEHFMGAIVCTALEHTPGRVPGYLLVDGQQRVITVVILLCALRDIVKSRTALMTMAQEIADNYLVHKHKEGFEKFKVIPRTIDRQSFFEMIQKKESFPGQNGLGKAYSFFLDKLMGFEDERLTKFFQAVIDKLKFVQITVEEENPFLIFETLNARGIPLLQSDMIRNFVFMKLSLQDQDEFDTNNWQPFEDLFGANEKFKQPVDLDDFYMHYLMSSGRYVRKQEIYVQFKERFDKLDASKIVQELTSSAEEYIKFYQPDRVKDEKIRLELSRIRELKHTTCYPLLLNIFTSDSEHEEEPTAKAELLRSLESFILRRQVRGLQTRSYGKWFTEMCAFKPVEQNSKLYESLRNKGWPDDGQFTLALQTFELYTSGFAKMILLAIEESIGSKERVVTSNLEVEHIMPQTISEDEDGMAWKEMLGPRWQEIHKTWQHSIGNLTLTGYNGELGNLPFEDKKGIYLDSKLSLNKYFATVEKWGEEEIKIRAELLARIVASIWPVHYSGNVDLEDAEQERDALRAIVIDGEEIAVSKYAQVVQKTAEWLYDRGKLKISDLPISFGEGEILLVSEKPKHRDGRDFKRKAPIPALPKQPLFWANTDYNAQDCIRNCTRLLQKYSTRSFEILFEDGKRNKII